MYYVIKQRSIKKFVKTKLKNKANLKEPIWENKAT